MSDRMKRNLELAEKNFDAFHHGPERGYISTWDGDDFAEGATVFLPRFGESTVPPGDAFRKGCELEQQLVYWPTFPDWHTESFHAFATDEGCAFRRKFCGHTNADGAYYEYWGSWFIWTNDEGKITRGEVYDDWDAVPKILKLCTGLDDHEITIENYTKFFGDAVDLSLFQS